MENKHSSPAKPSHNDKSFGLRKKPDQSISKTSYICFIVVDCLSFDCSADDHTHNDNTSDTSIDYGSMGDDKNQDISKE